MSASSWHVPELVDFMSRRNLKRFAAHVCRPNMTSTDNVGDGLANTPNGLLTNAEHTQNKLDEHCVGGMEWERHRHVDLPDGRAKTTNCS